MVFLIIHAGKIANIIEADEAFATEIYANPYYEGAAIGEPYSPPPPPPTQQEEIEALKIRAQAAENALLFLMDNGGI